MICKERAFPQARFGHAGFFHARGYATEAVAEVVRYGFEERSLRRIRANHFGSNEASGRVLRKVGMSYVGTVPNLVTKPWSRSSGSRPSAVPSQAPARMPPGLAQ
jgi:hypothetical protein